MNGLIGDRFLKRFLKGIRRPSKPASAPEADALAESAVEKENQSDNPEKTETLEDEGECSKKFHHSSGVNEKQSAN